MHSRRSFLQHSLLAASAASFFLNSLAKAAEAASVPQASRILVALVLAAALTSGTRAGRKHRHTTGQEPLCRVDNKPGANGQIAAQILLNAPSDGGTYLIAPLITPVLSQIVYKKPGYDPARDFSRSACSRISSSVWPFRATPGAEYSEYVAWLKAHPQQANFGSSAVGSLPHFFGLLLGEAAGVNIVHVPYKGGPAMMTDLISGQLASAIQTTSELAPCTRKARCAFWAPSATSAAANCPRCRPCRSRLSQGHGQRLVQPVGA